MSKAICPPVGHHILVDLFGCQCDEVWLADATFGRKVMDECSKYFNVLGTQCYQFEPYSYSIAVLLMESHLSIHTWTQFRKVTADLYTCTGELPEAPLRLLTHYFKPQKMLEVRVRRGSHDPVQRIETDFDASSV